jgi:hypothetical protein
MLLLSFGYNCCGGGPQHGLALFFPHSQLILHLSLSTSHGCCMCSFRRSDNLNDNMFSMSHNLLHLIVN